MKPRVSTVLSAVLIPFLAIVAPQVASAAKEYRPVNRPVQIFAPLDMRAADRHDRANPPAPRTEIHVINEPQPPPQGRKGVAIRGVSGRAAAEATPLSPTGPSPIPAKTFQAEFLSSASIPPDTMGAVGTTHIVSVTNDRLRIHTRDGIEVSRVTLTSFWAGVTIKGAAAAAFDPKVFYDRFNNRFILVSSANSVSINSGALFAVSQTSDPTGLWNRVSVEADPTSTATAGRWIDYPSVGFNKDWIVVNENVFNYAGAPAASTGYWGPQIYVIDKAAFYANTLGTIPLFEEDFNAVCLAATPAVQPTLLSCGFTMNPALTEDNTTATVYLVEDWDSTAAQLRLSKITGLVAAPVLTVGTQFPQSTHSWRFNASRIGPASGGYLPQRQQAANLPSGSRVMANDSRIQNAVLRNGSLWTTHTVMLSPTPQLAGVTIGGAANPIIDTHSGVQWWEIDPTIETGLSTPPIQRARIEDPSADNCHDGNAGLNAAGPRCTSTLTQTGEFYAFPSVSVNQNDDVLIGFSRFSPLTFPYSAYAMKLAADPVNTTRDPVVFRPGQANYNIGSGTGLTRQNRWGDYSASQTDPLNDVDFWTVQEYAGAHRDFGIGIAGPWETWWSMVRPGDALPTAGTLIVNEFRLRGPQGVRDELVELYNPGATPVIVTTTDGSDGWALAFSTNGTAVAGIAVVPNGTVIPVAGSFLVTHNQITGSGPTVVYGLNTYPGVAARPANGDTGYAIDLADNGGLALFNTATVANFAAGTRLDSVGFSSIAAGLFREGVGLAPLTAATPVGQMTFHRNEETGAPADTGANENDFQFADPIDETATLGPTPNLGAAGPENLSAPGRITAGGPLVATLLDPLAVIDITPNRVRDTTPGPVATSTLGTITFRRTFTNTTGAPIERLRFRILDLNTRPVIGGEADLRALSSSATTATVTGGGSVSVGGTTLETPPTQAEGGGFNSSLSADAVTLATPLANAASLNLQFVFGVQVQGTYDFCLMAEAVPASASSLVCFLGNADSTPVDLFEVDVD